MGRKKGFSKAIEELEDATKGFSDFGALGERLKDRVEEELGRFKDAVEDLKPELENLQEKFESEVKKAKVKVKNQVQEQPLTTLGIVGLIFFVLGLFLGARCTRGRD